MKSMARHLDKSCAVCGKALKVILYKDKTYRGGHYFGKVPRYRKGALDKARRAGTKKVKMGNLVVDILKKDPKPYAHREYWECPKCYWNK